MKEQDGYVKRRGSTSTRSTQVSRRGTWRVGYDLTYAQLSATGGSSVLTLPNLRTLRLGHGDDECVVHVLGTAHISETSSAQV